jgi:Zn-dependent protease
MFWLVSIALGLRLPPLELLVWVLVVVVSIAVHELGHASAFAWFRYRSRIVLYGLGGLTIPSAGPNASSLDSWRRAVVSAAGPGAGFVLAACAFLMLPRVVSTTAGLPGALYYHLIWINLAWGALNLLPVWPLDGGQVARSVLTAMAGDNGHAAAAALSLITAMAGVVVAWRMGLPLASLFFAYFALMEWRRTF